MRRCVPGRDHNLRGRRHEMDCSRWDDGRGDLVESPEPAGISLKVVGQIETPCSPDPIVRRPCVDRKKKRVTHGSDKIRTRTKQEQLDPADLETATQRVALA